MSRTGAARAAPAMLELEGSAYEMGWWHGHHLKEEIRRFVPRWRDVLFVATVGVPYAERQHAAARALRETVEFYVDQCQHRMSERLKQEYDGLSKGCGLSVYELIELEVLRDVLRTKGLDARITGAMGTTVIGVSMKLRAWWAGEDAALWSENLLLIRRKPLGGHPHTVVTWPGSLGAMAGLREDGMAVVVAELDVTDEHRRGFSGGVPFAITVRERLEQSASFRDLATGLTGTMGHAVLGADGARKAAVGSVETSVSGREVPQFLGDTRFLAVGPYERLPGPRADVLSAAVNAPRISHADRFAVVRRHADGDPKTSVHGPSLEMHWHVKGVTLQVWRENGGLARRVSYKAKE